MALIVPLSRGGVRGNGSLPNTRVIAGQSPRDPFTRTVLESVPTAWSWVPGQPARP
jgi:hypothetical protein